MQLNTFGLFFVAKKAGAQRFIVDARASIRHFLTLLCGPLLTREGLFRVEFQGTPKDAQNWYVGTADINNAFHQMRILVWLQATFALPAVLASDCDYTGKSIERKRLFFLFLQHFQWFFKPFSSKPVCACVLCRVFSRSHFVRLCGFLHVHLWFEVSWYALRMGMLKSVARVLHNTHKKWRVEEELE